MNINDTPHVGQGRGRHHSPKLNRDVAIGLGLVLVPWLFGLGVWLWA